MTGRAWIEHFKLTVLLSGLLLACSAQPVISAREAADANDTGGSLPITSDVERALLRQLPTLPVGTSQQVMNATVVADAPYTAASDRICRELHLTVGSSGQKTDRLACKSGNGWFFAPEIFGGHSAAE